MSLQSRIAKYATETPEKVAIQHRGRGTTYAELERFSNRLGQFLKEHHRSENKNILIYLDKSPELIGAIVGILKFSGVFVPLDIGHVLPRIKSYLEVSKAEWIVTKAEHLPALHEVCQGIKTQINLLLVDDALPDRSEFREFTLHTLSDSAESEQLQVEEVEANPHCYLYFTSGSTGKPKAILGRSRSLEHFMEWEIQEFQLGQSDCYSQLTSPAFDPFLREIFVPLTSGGTISIPESLSLPYLIKWIFEQKVTVIHTTPSYFKRLIEEVRDPEAFPALRYILLAGEMLRGRDMERFYQLFKNRIQLINLYGPTETTLAKLFYRVQIADSEQELIPVGKPISVTEVIILDNFKQPCPIGTVGEVYIRTPFMSAGYYNQPELTKEVFIQNPFNNNPKDLIYKTGDLGKKLPDGNVQLLGRVDHQLKIRGMRIEPGEIENRLLQYHPIQEAAVLPLGEESDRYLVGFIVTTEPVRVEEVKEYLAKHLPPYMIPEQIVTMPEMPLNSNGKVDRKALALEKIERQVIYIAPENELESELSQIWANVLEREQVGVTDNFTELGGHSLRAIALSAQIYTKFQLELSLRDIYQHPTIRQQAKLLEGALLHGVRLTEDSVGLLLNHEKEKKIFCFPPIIGYGLVYKSLAELLKNHALYALNYQDAANLVEEYITYIQNIEPEGPYYFLGYSAGGGLAFDVARKLEEMGHEVADIIMLDSYRNEERTQVTDEEYAKMVEKLLSEIQDEGVKAILAIESIKQRVKAKIIHYYKYKNETLNLGKVSAAIHFITSEQGDRGQSWLEATNGEYKVYQGYGSHSEMIEGASLKDNASIIKQILKG